MQENANDMNGLAKTLRTETEAIESLVAAAHPQYHEKHAGHRKLANAIEDAQEVQQPWQARADRKHDDAVQEWEDR